MKTETCKLLKPGGTAHVRFVLNMFFNDFMYYFSEVSAMVVRIRIHISVLQIRVSGERIVANFAFLLEKDSKVSIKLDIVHVFLQLLCKKFNSG